MKGYIGYLCTPYHAVRVSDGLGAREVHKPGRRMGNRSAVVLLAAAAAAAAARVVQLHPDKQCVPLRLHEHKDGAVIQQHSPVAAPLCSRAGPHVVCGFRFVRACIAIGGTRRGRERGATQRPPALFQMYNKRQYCGDPAPFHGGRTRRHSSGHHSAQPVLYCTRRSCLSHHGKRLTPVSVSTVKHVCELCNRPAPKSDHARWRNVPR